MTYSYTADVATSSGFGCFLPLLLRWRGSIYKLVWLDLLTFLSLYYVLNLSYRFLMDADQKRVFENVAKYCGNSSLIPLSFVLGFYVSIVMGRWWAQYLAIPWPDSIAVYVSAHIHGNDERGRLLRRTVMRYVCLCLTMVFTYVSQRVKKRFPTWDYLVDAGLLLENEKLIIDRLDVLFPYYPKHWLPIVWSASIIKLARGEGRIRDDFAVKTIIDELNKFRGSAGFVLFYDFISVPLVYTQVVTLAVYSYLIFSIMGSQCLDTPNEEGYYDVVDKYFPIFATLEFFFYMGWLKVAESLINPFGEDDDDFEVNWLVDRNLQVSYLIVDDMHNDHPELVRDQFWDEVFPTELRYSTTNKVKREEPPEPSTARVGNQILQSSVDYRSPINFTKAFSRYSSFTNRQVQKNASSNSNNTVSESSASTSSKQIGIVTPLNISKSAKQEAFPKDENLLLPLPIPQTTAPAGIIDDFEILRRKREEERLQRHSNNLNRTVENLHNIAESSTIIQLVPTRRLVLTDSEASFAAELLSDDQQDIHDNNKDKAKNKTKLKVTISEPLKSQDNKLKTAQSEITQNATRLEILASKAAERASTSKDASRRSTEIGLQTDKMATDKPNATKQYSYVETDLKSDSEGSISFSDVQGDEKSGDEENNARTKKQQKRQSNDSEAGTLFSDATDEASDYEKPEIFIDKTAESEASSVYEDVAGESTVNDVNEQSNWQSAETDASAEYYDPPDETTRDESKDKTKPKNQDKTKKKR